MKKNIEWLKNEVNGLPLHFLGFSMLKQRGESSVSKDDVLELIDQLDEPEVLSQELPVIPKYVADLITQYREVFDLYQALKILENNSLIWERIYKWYRMNTYKFVNAYLTGEYEVENEP